MTTIFTGVSLGCRCEITIMSLDHEALYVVRTVGVFELPQNNLQLSLLCPALGPLKFVHVSAD